MQCPNSTMAYRPRSSALRDDVSRFRAPSRHRFDEWIQLSDLTGRSGADKGVGGDWTVHDRTGTDDRAGADGDAGKDDRAGADPASVADRHGVAEGSTRPSILGADVVARRDERDVVGNVDMFPMVIGADVSNRTRSFTKHW